MKKVLTCLLVMIAILGIHLCVFADMGIPGIRSYEAVVTNINGAECVIGYGDNQRTEILPYGTKIKVDYEYRLEEGIKASFMPENSIYDGTINISDIKPVKEVYVSNNLIKNEPYNFVVLAKEGVEIYNGPADAYSKTGIVIPMGTEIVAYSERDISESPWYYVTYNGNSGWICELDSALVRKIGDGDVYMTVGETSLVEYGRSYIGGSDVPKELAVIPANTFIENVYVTDPWSQGYLVMYNGMLGEVYNRSFAWSHDVRSLEITEKPVKMYESCDENSKVIIDEIPVGTIISYELENEYSGYVYATYNGKTGWVYVESFESLDTVEKNPELPKLVKVNNDGDNDKILKEIKSIAKTLGNVETNKDVKENNKQQDTAKNEDVAVSNQSNILVNDESAVENKENTIINYIVSPKELVGAAVIIAIVVSLTCVVTIVLINKKSSSKKDVENKDKELKKDDIEKSEK